MTRMLPTMRMLRRLADNTSPRSLAVRLRKKRFRLFKKLVSAVDKTPLEILDVGGTFDFWKKMDFLTENGKVKLTLLNLFQARINYPHVTSVLGDGRNMKQFSNRQFDMVFSNSVIEHLPDLTDQKKMADEIRRVGNGYFVQTPNLYFPLEPHFLFPFFQFLPLGLKTLLLRYFKIGWHGPFKDPQKAREIAASIRLLGKAEVACLFPDARIYEEKYLGFPKSFVAFRPWTPEREKVTARCSVREDASAPGRQDSAQPPVCSSRARRPR